MYTIRLTCTSDESDFVSADLWEAGTVAIREIDSPPDTHLIAAFETNDSREHLLSQFTAYSPEWRHEPPIDWIEHTHAAWPPRSIGEKIFLAPVWSLEPTPPRRVRIIHNPGLACGTGEHPCTQLALIAMEKCISPGSRVADIGCGSGLLAIAALRLGASFALGTDTDAEALHAARENFELNELVPQLVTGSAECLPDAFADVTVANINGTVLLSILDDLLRVTPPSGCLILTGFTHVESRAFAQLSSEAQTLELEEWRCVILTPSSVA